MFLNVVPPPPLPVHLMHSKVNIALVHVSCGIAPGAVQLAIHRYETDDGRD